MYISFHKSRKLFYILLFCIPFIFKEYFEKKLELINYNIIKNFSCCFLFFIYLIEKRLSKIQLSSNNYKLNFKFSKIIMFILLIISNLLSLYLSIVFFRKIDLFNNLIYSFIFYL